MKNHLFTIGFYFAFVFCLLHLILFPVPYYFLPHIGSWFTPALNPIISIAGDTMGVQEPFTRELWSDSKGHYIFIFLTTLFSLPAAVIIWWRKKEISPKVKFWFYTVISYYLSLTLFKYGADKLFKHQFYLPEPNTLFTPVGKLSKDMLFWSTMGSSYSYTVFSGIVEIVPAILLLFKKTRILGTLIATGVMINVVMLNFGFDITVKLYSLFLLFICLILLSPYFRNLYDFFFGNKSTQIQVQGFVPSSSKTVLWYSIIKSLIIGVILYESLGFYFATGNLNDDLSARPELHGAYDIYLFTDQGKIIPASMSYPGRFRRIFFHRRNYFIVQTMDDEFIDYDVQIDTENQTLLLYHKALEGHVDPTSELNYRVNDDKLVIYGYFFDSYITLFSQKIQLEDLPLMNNTIHWTIDDFKE